MKRTLFLFAALLALVVNNFLYAEPNQQIASRDLTIGTTDLQTAFPGHDVATNILIERAKAVAPKFDLSTQNIASWLIMTVSDSDLIAGGRPLTPHPYSFTIRLSVTMAGESDAVPNKVLDAILDGAPDQISKAYTAYEQDLVRTTLQKRADAQKRYIAATQKSTDYQAQAEGIAGRTTLNDDTLRASEAKLEDQSQQLDLDIIAKTARRQELELQLAKLTQAADKKMEDDPVVVQLKKLVDTREAELKQVRQMTKAGLATPKDESEAASNAADAQARLAQRQHDAALEAGGQSLQTFSQELVTLAVDLRELTARREFISTKLDQLHQVLGLLKKANEAEHEAQATRRGIPMPFDLPESIDTVPRIMVDIKNPNERPH